MRLAAILHASQQSIAMLDSRNNRVVVVEKTVLTHEGWGPFEISNCRDSAGRSWVGIEGGPVSMGWFLAL